MANGIKVDEQSFETLKPDEKMRAIFQAIVATNDNFLKQPALCSTIMDDKIKINNKISRRINLGIGGGGGIGVVAVFEFIRSFWPK